MSIHKEGTKWRVKYRLAGRSTVARSTARATRSLFDADIRRRRQLGPVLAAELQRETETLDQFIRGSWRAHAATLAPKTTPEVRWVLSNHLGTLGDEPLATLDVARLAAHQRHLLDRGVRPNTVRAVHAQIAGILQIAVEYGRIPANPARSMRKIKADPIAPVRPLEPIEIEALIAATTGRDRAMIVLGGYFGLRPIEIRRVTWSRLHGNTLTVAKVDTKPSASPRTITGPDRRHHRTQDVEVRVWSTRRRRTDHRADVAQHERVERAPASHRPRRRRPHDVTAYTLRHSHASALHHCGFTVPRAAERMGHTTIVHLGTYAHVLDTMDRYADIDDDDRRRPRTELGDPDARAKRARTQKVAGHPTGSAHVP